MHKNFINNPRSSEIYIRVNGNCTRPKPEGFEVKYFCRKTGKQVVNADQEEPFNKIINDPGVTDKNTWVELKKKYIFSDDKSDCDAYIESYHIDSELGLYIFLQELKAYYET